jgi:hypothetical protein
LHTFVLPHHVDPLEQALAHDVAHAMLVERDA